MLEGLTPPKRTLPCKVRDVLENLNAEDQEILTNALADYKLWSARTLELELRKRGIMISDSSIERHRAGVCSC